MKDKANKRESKENKNKANEAEARKFRDAQNQYVYDALASPGGFCNPIKLKIEAEEDDENWD